MSKALLNRLKLGEGGFYIVLALVFTAIVAFLGSPLVSTYLKDVGHDGQWYIKIAEGRIGEVLQPFSGRILYPFIAGWFEKNLPLDIGQSFFLIGMVSLFCFLITTSRILKKNLKSPLLVIPLFFLPYFIWVSREVFLPDIFYVFLTALFFLCLFLKKESVGLITLFLLFLTRESTIVLGLILLLFSLMRSKKILFAATLVVIAISVFTTGQISSLGLSNPHNVGSSFYLVLKFVYNSLNNFFGIKLWANTLAQSCEPVFRIVLPNWPLFGSVREAGFCGFDFSSPINSFLALTTTFGVAPLVFFYLFLKKTKFILREAPFWVSIAAVYGLVYYFLGVSAGTGVARMVGYSWPAFLLATPFLMGVFFETNKNFIVKLSLIQLLVAWLPFAIQVTTGYSISTALFVIQVTTGYSISTALLSVFLTASIYFWSFFFLKNQKTIHDGRFLQAKT